MVDGRGSVRTEVYGLVTPCTVYTVTKLKRIDVAEKYLVALVRGPFVLPLFALLRQQHVCVVVG